MKINEIKLLYKQELKEINQKQELKLNEIKQEYNENIKKFHEKQFI